MRDSPELGYYDPRKWIRECEVTMVKRVKDGLFIPSRNGVNTRVTVIFLNSGVNSLSLKTIDTWHGDRRAARTFRLSTFQGLSDLTIFWTRLFSCNLRSAVKPVAEERERMIPASTRRTKLWAHSEIQCKIRLLGVQ